MTRIRKLHRIIGLVMLLPLMAWAITGAIFFLKPGYAGAYDVPQIKTYPIGIIAPVSPDPAWLEYRLLKTALGEHLLVRTTQGWQQFDPITLQPRAEPTADELRTLFSDSLASNPARYGHIINIEGLTATTGTGVRVTLDWNRLTLTQYGGDTGWIDRFYKIHYLQWTGIAALDKVLGGLGILLVLALSLLGARLFFKG
jgi:hypothetical protein